MIFFYALLNGGANQLKNPSKNDNFLFILSFFGLFLCIGYKTDVAFSTKIVCQKLYKKIKSPASSKSRGFDLYWGKIGYRVIHATLYVLSVSAVAVSPGIYS